MPENCKHPIILPKDHYVSELILRQIHIDLQHSVRNYLLAHLRETYWLINAPSVVRKLIKKCVVCRRLSAPVGEQKMANLPPDRITPEEPPFPRVGVDYFGPFKVKQHRCRIKRFGVSFTCLSSRAIHLEAAASLDTSSYINVLRRFIARRGQVEKIRSDNIRNFVGAERELKSSLHVSEWNLNKIENAMLQKNIDWQFNPPAGSHFGVVWERLIRSVRKTMNSVIREEILGDDGLNTMFCEIESTHNSRPITMNSDDPSDLEALTPNHLLIMKRKQNLLPSKMETNSVHCKSILESLGPRVPSRVTRSQKWHKQRKNLMVRDIVIVVDSNAPRISLPMGQISEIFPDRNGLVRQVKVKIGHNVLTRPVYKLCTLLELG
ncbi:unnamed protein product [Mytilus coruscus]|uniref:Integrase catalytic domain-containing protein n=1 Tax=Mytilus coruscus TaxID=42192 RepID=A0A6J8AX33_MYTCO|nr:unnamed protein product [Mytilus coruscus]